MPDDRKYSLIVIGPMSDRGLDRIKKLVPVSLHMSNICEAIRICERELRDGIPGLKFEIQTALDISVNGIKEAVIRMMDQADFAIADVSFDSPATIYEIAILHAMGIPVAFIDYNYANNDTKQVQFYLRDQKLYRVNDFTIENLSSVLLPALKGVIDFVDREEVSINPISQHYDSFPLMEASAVTGLAIGQFHNFIRHAIDQNGAITRSGGKYTKLVLIEPLGLHDVGKARAELEALDGFRPFFELKAPSHPREAMTVSAINRTIVDFPTPLSSLTISPRYKAVLSDKNLNTEQGSEKIVRFERRLIRQYLNTLKRLAKREPSANPDLLAYMPLEQLLDAVQRGEI